MEETWFPLMYRQSKKNQVCKEQKRKMNYSKQKLTTEKRRDCDTAISPLFDVTDHKLKKLGSAHIVGQRLVDLGLQCLGLRLSGDRADDMG